MNSKAESHLSDPAKEHLISDVATITIRNTRNIRNIRNIARVPLGFIDLNAAAPRGCAGAAGRAFFKFTGLISRPLKSGATIAHGACPAGTRRERMGPRYFL